MTVVGTVDPVYVVRKLRKRFCSVWMVSVGPAKEEVKKEVSVDPAKEAEKKTNEGGGDKKDTNTLVPVYLPWYPHPCYFVHTEEHPHACVIC